MNPLFTIAATADIHLEKYQINKSFFDQANEKASLFILGGDIGNGKERDIDSFLFLIRDVKIPVIIIFGNHDCDANNLELAKKKLSRNRLINILDGDYVSFNLNKHSVGITGVKGYGGGFAPYRVIDRGEIATKNLVSEENSEVDKLRMASEKMKMDNPDFKIALTHYAAFKETLEGESQELFLLLGSSRMGDVIESFGYGFALSGHAHHGISGIKKAREGKIFACNIGYKANENKLCFFDFYSQRNVRLYYPESQ